MKPLSTTLALALSLAPFAALASGAPADSATPVAPALAPSALAIPAVVTQDEEPEDGREQIKELIGALAKHAKQRGKEDQEAVALIDQLLQEFPDCGPKDRAAVVKALDKLFKAKRPEQDGGRQNQLFLAAATALGEMAPESVDVLVDWIDHKTHRRDLALQRVLILKAGSTVHKDAHKAIFKLLKHHEPQMQAAAAEALGNYGESDEKVRKDTFEGLLKLMMNVKGQKDTDPNDIIARERWDIISAPIITSLQALSGEQIRDPQEWQRWWNKNKKSDWAA